MGWVATATPRPLYNSERDPVLIVQEAWWAPVSVWTGFDPRTVQSIPSRYTDYAVAAHSDCQFLNDTTSQCYRFSATDNVVNFSCDKFVMDKWERNRYVKEKYESLAILPTLDIL